jgi:hypothetical protein
MVFAGRKRRHCYGRGIHSVAHGKVEAYLSKFTNPSHENQTLMEAEVAARIGAERYERNTEMAFKHPLEGQFPYVWLGNGLLGDFAVGNWRFVLVLQGLETIEPV